MQEFMSALTSHQAGPTVYPPYLPGEPTPFSNVGWLSRSDCCLSTSSERVQAWHCACSWDEGGGGVNQHGA